jgi:hypothetical protein
MKTPENDSQDMRGKNFQNLIVKPPPPKTAVSFANSRERLPPPERKANTA